MRNLIYILIINLLYKEVDYNLILYLTKKTSMEYLIIIAFAWWFVEFEPIQFIIDKAFEYLPIHFLTDWIYSGLGCFKCMGFWSGLIYSGSFGFACVTSLLTYIISLCLSKMN